MELDKRVKRLSPGEFRSDIHLEDIRKGYGEEVDVYSSDERFTKDGVNLSESALVFVDDPVVVPSMKYIFKVRIKSVRNHMLKRAVSDLMFLNPNIGEEGIKRMAEWILRVMVHYSKEQKRYAIDRGQIIEAILDLMDSDDVVNMDIVEKDKVIIYKRYSILTQHDRTHYSLMYRGRRMEEMYGAMLHDAAIYASEKLHQMLMIKKRHVIEHSKTPVTRYKANKYMMDKTIRFLEDENNFRYFDSEKGLEKFLIVSEMYEPGKPIREYVSAANISNSTAIKYIDIIENEY